MFLYYTTPLKHIFRIIVQTVQCGQDWALVLYKVQWGAGTRTTDRTNLRVSALDHNLDRSPGPGLGRLEGLYCLLQTEPVLTPHYRTLLCYR